MIILEQLQISSIIDIQESSSVAGQDQRRCLGWIQVGASVRADVMFKVLPADESYTAVSAYRASINRIPRDWKVGPCITAMPCTWMRCRRNV